MLVLIVPNVYKKVSIFVNLIVFCNIQKSSKKHTIACARAIKSNTCQNILQTQEDSQHK